MLSVLIVDDEVKVSKLIYHLVDWESLNLEVVNIVHDGQTALEFIIEYHPKIVITDIRMPSCDGLEMIKQVRERNIDTHFIIISGYSNFEYAKNAIYYGVEDYLLKPLEGKELIATLQKITEKYYNEVWKKQEQNMLKELVESSREKIQSSLISDMLLNPDQVSTKTIEMVNEEYQSNFQDGYFAFVKIQPFIRGQLMTEEELGIVLPKLYKLVKERLKGICYENILKETDSCVLGIVNAEDQNMEAIKKQANRMRLDIWNMNHIFKELKVFMGIGGAVTSISALSLSMEQANLALMNRILDENQMVITYKEPEVSKMGVDGLIDIQFRNELTGNLERLHGEGIRKCIEDLKEKLKPYKRNGVLVYGCYKEIVSIFTQSASRFKFDAKQIELHNLLLEYDKYMTFEEIFAGLASDMIQMIESYSKNKKMEEAKPIRLAKQFISEKYNEPLSLEIVSDVIGFNPAYFSTLFKKETGKSFMEYIMELRVQNAKNILVSTDMTLSQVSGEVGYSDFKYFTKIFKRITGLTPSEYRRLYS